VLPSSSRLLEGAASRQGKGEKRKRGGKGKRKREGKRERGGREGEDGEGRGREREEITGRVLLPTFRRWLKLHFNPGCRVICFTFEVIRESQ